MHVVQCLASHIHLRHMAAVTCALQLPAKRQYGIWTFVRGESDSYAPRQTVTQMHLCVAVTDTQIPSQHKYDTNTQYPPMRVLQMLPKPQMNSSICTSAQQEAGFNFADVLHNLTASSPIISSCPYYIVNGFNQLGMKWNISRLLNKNSMVSRGFHGETSTRKRSPAANTFHLSLKSQSEDHGVRISADFCIVTCV